MHFVAFAIILFACPAFVGWMRANPKQVHWAYLALGMLPFTLNSWNLDGALINWNTWPGYTKGIVITMLDAIALAVIISHRQPKGLPPLAGYLIAYMLAALLSVLSSDVPMGSVFYPFQLLRVLILMIAVAKIVGSEKGMTWLAMGVASGLAYQAYWCIVQKAQGAFQAAGTMGHQNLLGLMAEFGLVLLVAMLARGSRNRVIMLGVVSALAVIGLGASRGAVAFSLGGVGAFMALSIMFRPTQRKWHVVGFSALALAITAPVIVQGMNNRMGQLAQAGHSEGVDEERLAFARAANAMWADHPMGVGANQYVVVANGQGYSERAGVIWNWTSRAANVHNTYLLVASETGWPGLIAFVAMYVGIGVAGLSFVLRNRRDPRADIVLACTVSTVTIAIHIQYEWIWVLYQQQYMFAISAGIISGLTRAKAVERREARRKRFEEAFETDPGLVPSPAE